MIGKIGICLRSLGLGENMFPPVACTLESIGKPLLGKGWARSGFAYEKPEQKLKLFP